MLEPTSGDQLTYAQFRAFVANKDERYEYVDGRAVAMGIPTDEHQRLVKILNRKLDDHLGAGPCEALPSVALRTIERERAPDILIRCRNKASEREARFVIEIMSANHGDDLGDKVTEYQAILFATGDLVRLVQPGGKYTGTHIGMVAVRARGDFDLKCGKFKITSAAKNFTLVQRSNGYAFAA